MIAPDIIFGILGNITTVLLFSSPISQFMEMVKRKSAENYNATPYVTMLLSCSLWILYGIFDPDEGLVIITVNGAGLTLQALYLTLFFIYASQEKRVQYFGFVIMDFVVFGVILAITLVAFEEGSRRKFMGVVCATLTVITYAAPMAAVGSAIKMRSVEYLPVLLVLFIFINGCVWATFALLVTDIYVLVPSLVGIILGAIQLSVYLSYRNKTQFPESVHTVKELEDDSFVMQIDSRGVDMEEKMNMGIYQQRALTRQDAFPIIRSPSFSPDRSNPQLVENGNVD